MGTLVKPSDYSLYAGFIHLGAGLACGFTGLAAGYAIGFVGDSVRSQCFLCKVIYSHSMSVCTSICLRVESVCLHASHSHFRRGVRSLRVCQGLFVLPPLLAHIAYRLIVALIMNSRATEAPSCHWAGYTPAFALHLYFPHIWTFIIQTNRKK